MSGSVNEEDGLRWSIGRMVGRIYQRCRWRRRESRSGKGREDGRKEASHGGKHHYEIQGMEHILWWLRLISIDIEHFAWESRRVQWCMSVKGPAAPPDCGAGAVWRLHIAAKSMGGWGAVYQIASMSSERGVCTPSPQLTVWLLSILRLLRCDIQDPEKSGKRKNQGLLRRGKKEAGGGNGRRRATDFEIKGGKKPSLTKCQCQSESSLRCRYLENEKRMIRIKHLGFVDCALRYSWNMKRPKLQMKIASNIQHFEHLKAAMFKAILASLVSNSLRWILPWNAIIRRACQSQ